jgi:hypothetical protein
MRGTDARSGELFSYVDLEKRVPAKHPLRLVRGVARTSVRPSTGPSFASNVRAMSD